MCVRWGVQKCSFWVSQNTLFWVIMGTPNHHFWVSLLTPYMVLSPVNMVSKTDHELIIYDTWSCHQIWGFWAIPGDQVFRALSGVPPKTSKNMVLSPETTETLFDGFGQNSIVDWSYMTHDHVSYMINPWSLLEQLLTPYMVLSPVIWCPESAQKVIILGVTKHPFLGDYGYPKSPLLGVTFDTIHGTLSGKYGVQNWSWIDHIWHMIMSPNMRFLSDTRWSGFSSTFWGTSKNLKKHGTLSGNHRNAFWRFWTKLDRGLIIYDTWSCVIYDQSMITFGAIIDTIHGTLSGNMVSKTVSRKWPKIITFWPLLEHFLDPFWTPYLVVLAQYL